MLTETKAESESSERLIAMQKRRVAGWYIAIAVFYFILYACVDAYTQNAVNEGHIFYNWTVSHAKHIYESLCDGHLSLIRDNHFFPMWGTAIFLALTDVGFLHNDVYLTYRLVLIALLVTSNILGTSVLKDRFGSLGLYLGSLLGLNPIYFQLLGGLYDQVLFCPLFFCASMLLIKSETCNSPKWTWRLLTALILGIGANIRPDMTYTYLAYLVLRLRRTSRIVKCQLAVSALVFLLCLAPWSFLYYKRSHLFSLTSANTGGFAYLSLGQGSDRVWGGGAFTPWGVVHLDSWDINEVLDRINKLKPDYSISSIFSDPWASKIYFDMFLKEATSRPYDYCRISLEKAKKIVFAISPFEPNVWLQFGQDRSPFLHRVSHQVLSTMCFFHRITTLILIYFGIHFLFVGMKHPLFHTGGFFFLVSAMLCALLQYVNKHLFALAAFQGISLLAAIAILYEQLKTVAAKKPRLRDFSFSALSGGLSSRCVLHATGYFLPCVLMLLLFFQEAVLGPYRRDRVYVDQVDLWKTKWNIKRPGTIWCSAGNFIFSSKGIIVQLGEPFYAKWLDISLDSNDRYEIRYLLIHENREQQVVAQQEMPIAPQPSQGLAVYDIEVPREAVETGYNAILVKPVAGDGCYALGHLRPHD